MELLSQGVSDRVCWRLNVPVLVLFWQGVSERVKPADPGPAAGGRLLRLPLASRGVL